MISRLAGWQDAQAASTESRLSLAPTLGQYVARLEARGLGCALAAEGTEAWVPGARSELQRLPLECTAEPDPALLRRLLSRPGVWVVSYQQQGRESHPANCVLYICRDPSYSIDTLSRNGRRDVRRGQRNFTVRPCSWSELAAKGFRAQADTAIRHGYSLPSPAEFERGVRRLQDCSCSQVWGAWNRDELAAWISVVRIEDWALINIARSCTAVLTLCPNNALLFAATRQLLVEEKRRHVTYGLSSIQISARDMSMHSYKGRMGYEAVPLHRRFVVHPLLRGAVSARFMSWWWDRLARVFPHREGLRKLAGMSRLLSGRDHTPLRWLEESPH